MLDRPVPHAFLRPPEAKDSVSLTGKLSLLGEMWFKFDQKRTLNLLAVPVYVKQDLEV